MNRYETMNQPRKAVRLLLIGSCVLAVCGVAHSQEEPAVDAQVSFTGRVLALANNQYDQYELASIGALSSTDGLEADLVVVEAGEANGRGTITWKPRPDCKAQATCWAFQLSAPTNKSSKQADFTNLDGLAKDLNVGFTFRRTLATKRAAASFYNALLEDAQIGSLDDTCERAVLSISALDALSNVDLVSACPGVDDFAKKGSTTWFVDGAVSVNDYDFFNELDAKEDTREYGFRLKAGLARLVDGSRLSVSLTFERSYKPSSMSAQLCEGVGVTGALETCTMHPLGSPAEIDSQLLQVEYRVRPVGVPVVLSPLASYDFEQDVSAFELPLYFLKDNEDKFRGGFKLGWRSDAREVVASVFVSKALEF